MSTFGSGYVKVDEMDPYFIAYQSLIELEEGIRNTIMVTAGELTDIYSAYYDSVSAAFKVDENTETIEDAEFTEVIND
jgi:hypothetical protein